MRALPILLALAAMSTPAGADDEAEMRANMFAGCHAVYHVMTLLAQQGKYSGDPDANAAARERFAKADERATELARDAYKVNGDDDETAQDNLDEAARQYEDASIELSGAKGVYDRAHLEQEVRNCDEFLKEE